MDNVPSTQGVVLTQHQRRPPPVCFGCGEPGHFRRECTRIRQRPAPTHEEAQPVSTARVMGAAGDDATSVEAYLEVKVNRRLHYCLLDTGCEVTVLPVRVLGNARVQPSPHRLLAANGTQIPIIGETRLAAQVGNQRIYITGLVSEHVSDVMLGIDWLRAQGVIWDFATGQIVLNGLPYRLVSRRDRELHCRRVVLSEDVVVPARCELDLPANMVYNHLNTKQSVQSECWSTEPRKISGGLLVARTILPDRASDLPVRVMNVTPKPVTLKKGTPISELRQVQPIQESQKQNVAQNAADKDVIDGLLSQIDPSVPDHSREDLRKILERYHTVFSKGEWDLGRTDIVTHSIDTADSRPVRQRMRRYPPMHLRAIDQHVDEMIRQGIIEPATSPWASNIVLAKKKDGTLRCCVDYRQLNDLTRKDAYPLPRIDACLDAMAGSRWFSTFDLRCSYHQVSMNPVDSDKTAFITRRGMFRFRTMPFGLCNAGATFQRLMDLVLAGLSMEACLVYLDDIILFSADLEGHFERLQKILDRLQQANLKLKPSKCVLLQTSVCFLGHVISGQGIATDPEKVHVVSEWPPPQNLRQLRGFLGITGYYRRFVKDYAKIAAPLNAITRKNQPFEWNEQCQIAFDRLKQALLSPPILAMPNDEGQYFLDTDASDHAIGAVLSQMQEGEERVIGYAGRALSRNEVNYCVTRKELLAVVYFTGYFRQYLLGRRFTVRTDHSALTWLRRTPEPIGQNARWLELLGEYDFVVQHRPGTKHSNADSISRRPCLNRPSCTACHPGLDVHSCMAVEVEPPNFFGEPADHSTSLFAGMADAQKADRDIGFVRTLLENRSDKPSWKDVELRSSEVKALWYEWERLAIRKDLLCRKWISADGLHLRWQVVVPFAFRPEIVRLAHAGITGGHLGRTKTEEQVRLRAYWPNWSYQVRTELRKCEECSRYKRGNAPKQTPLSPFPAGEPFETISVDITGKHPRSSRGNEFMITVVDSFSKWAEAYPVRVHTAPVVARVLMQNFFSRFGMPKRLLTDQGREFESELFSELCKRMEIDKVRTSPYHPACNGGVERFHRTLNSMLAKVVATSQKDWDEHLPTVMAAYRASRHEATGFSPNFLVFGHENRAPLDLVLGVVPEEQQLHDSYDDYVSELQRRQRDAYELARIHLGVSAQRRKEHYDIRVRPAKFEVGQWVWYFYPRRYVSRSPKWTKNYDGPFLVTRVIPPSDYVIQRSRRSSPQVVHGDKLKPCFGNHPASWLPEGDEAPPTPESPVVSTPVRQPSRSVDVQDNEHSEASPRLRLTPRNRRQPVRLADYVV